MVSGVSERARSPAHLVRSYRLRKANARVRSFGAAAQKVRLRINKQSFVQCVTCRRF